MNIPDEKMNIGSNFVRYEDRDDDLRKIKFSNGNSVPNMKGYFIQFRIIMFNILV
jgi:hypothetical protein